VYFFKRCYENCERGNSLTVGLIIHNFPSASVINLSAIVITPFIKIKSIFYNLPPIQQWNEQNISRALELLKSGEGADCVIEVQEQQPNDDGPSRKRSSKIGQAGIGTQQQQQQDVQSNFL
jgi:hypothetical protein